MQYLLYQAGIQWPDGPTGSSKGETHAWNVVRIDGAYYHLDPTWDDPVGQTGFDFISYAYFNLTDEEIRRDHEIDAEGGYPLPACTDTAAHYYRSRGLVYTSYSAADVAALIREAREQGPDTRAPLGGRGRRCLFPFHPGRLGCHLPSGGVPGRYPG